MYSADVFLVAPCQELINFRSCAHFGKAPHELIKIGNKSFLMGVLKNTLVLVGPSKTHFGFGGSFVLLVDLLCLWCKGLPKKREAGT